MRNTPHWQRSAASRGERGGQRHCGPATVLRKSLSHLGASTGQLRVSVPRAAGCGGSCISTAAPDAALQTCAPDAAPPTLRPRHCAADTVPQTFAPDLRPGLRLAWGSARTGVSLVSAADARTPPSLHAEGRRLPPSWAAAPVPGVIGPWGTIRFR